MHDTRRDIMTSSLRFRMRRIRSRYWAIVTVLAMIFSPRGIPFLAPQAVVQAQVQVAPIGNGFVLDTEDLRFICHKIGVTQQPVATASAGHPCDTLIGPGPNQVNSVSSPNGDPQLPVGLRTVDGSCNNLVPAPDQHNFGRADRLFPRLTTPVFRDAEQGTSYKQKLLNNTVIDSQPRIITNLMVMPRGLNQPGPDGVIGTADDIQETVNETTPWVDQNQTYTSHPSHQVFLRAYTLVNGRPRQTGLVLDGGFCAPRQGGSPGEQICDIGNWAEVKAQSAHILGIQLVDQDVLNVPLLLTDPYGHFKPGPNGFPQMVRPGNVLVEGNPAANGGPRVLVPSDAVPTGQPLLHDIAHNTVPPPRLVAAAAHQPVPRRSDEPRRGHRRGVRAHGLPSRPLDAAGAARPPQRGRLGQRDTTLRCVPEPARVQQRRTGGCVDGRQGRGRDRARPVEAGRQRARRVRHRLGA